MKTIKNYDIGRLSVTVKQIDQAEEIVSSRPLRDDEDFSTFHPITTNNIPQRVNPNDIGSYTKNVDGFNITITRKIK